MYTRADPSAATIDHAVIVGRTLERLAEPFAELGLEPVYAGPLANEVNHLSQLAFPDGSYFELLSTIEPEQTSPWWDDHLERDGGPCAFALESGDIEADTDRVREAGLPVTGPTRYGRERPDGTYFDYELSIVGDGGVATTYPFLIQDHTPRSKRVQWPSPSVADSDLTGIAGVVVGVEDLEAATATYAAAYGLDEPDPKPAPGLDARVAHFPDTPIVLATPAAGDAWLADRIERHGERPAAFLLGSTAFEATTERFDLTPGEPVLGTACAWLEREAFAAIDTRIGVLAA